MTVTPAGTEVAYTVTWLEMAARPAWRWPPQPSGGSVSLIRAEAPPAWYFLSLYDAVGRDYAWEDMHDHDEIELTTMLADPGVSLHTALRHGWPNGFFLLDARQSGTCELAYFGLVPEAVGRGLGTWLLRTAILTAWSLPDVAKLEVNTCTLDHPRALATYQKNGFVAVRREDRRRVLTRPRDLSRIPA